MTLARFLAGAPPARPSDLEAIRRLGLADLADGRPEELYHGTTAWFSSFDESRCRGELVENFYGAGVFLTPSWGVAARYARAARNRALPASLLDDLAAINPPAAAFLRVIHAEGRAGWERAVREGGFVRSSPAPGEGTWDIDGLTASLGMDPNDIADVAPYVEGAAEPAARGEDDSEIFAVLTGAPMGAPPWIYDSLDRMGLDSVRYRPKVYTASVTALSPAFARDEREARDAFARGHDCVVYVGPRRVGDAPEVALRRGASARVTSVELA